MCVWVINDSGDQATKNSYEKSDPSIVAARCMDFSVQEFRIGQKKYGFVKYTEFDLLETADINIRFHIWWPFYAETQTYVFS